MNDSFQGVIAFALLALMLWLGSVLRSRVPWLRTSLVPASIVGGVLGFLLLSFDLLPGYSPGDFTTLTFHFFTLSFMSLCLTGKAQKSDALGGGSIVRGGMWLTLAWSISLGLQGVIGYLIVTGYDVVTGSDISAWLGAIVTHGFTQGPGQALTYGGIWETEYGVANAAQVGMIYASLGFLMAFIVGVPIARRYLRKGFNANQASRLDASFRLGFFTSSADDGEAQAPTMGRMVSHPGNLDSLAYHLGLLAIAYVITHLWLTFIQGVIGDASPWGIKMGVLFSHNLFFLHGLGVCVLMRMIIDRLGLGHRVDDETLKRITGSSVDFMVVGTLMSIQFAVLYALLVPVLLVSIAVTVASLIGCVLIGRMSGKLGHERALTSFGCCCGSTGTGLLLLRMMDADFSTSVPKELALFNLAIVLVNLPILMIVAPIVPSLTGGTYLLIFGGSALFFTACLPLMWLWSRRRSVSLNSWTTATRVSSVAGAPRSDLSKGAAS
ncbi:sodium/glutamate symporter [Halomonas cupida]|uniref:sodium/glutamate symporter n=1 Tax=Halomonas cupida TaxID=44933 RepID=UPI003A8CBD67